MPAGSFSLGFISPTRFVFPVSKNCLRSSTHTCLGESAWVRKSLPANSGDEIDIAELARPARAGFCLALPNNWLAGRKSNKMKGGDMR
jgi:hypothetical protein